MKDREETLRNLRLHLKSSNPELRKAVAAEIKEIEEGRTFTPPATDDWRAKAQARLAEVEL